MMVLFVSFYVMRDFVDLTAQLCCGVCYDLMHIDKIVCGWLIVAGDVWATTTTLPTMNEAPTEQRQVLSTLPPLPSAPVHSLVPSTCQTKKLYIQSN